jgi:signal transduction histidine kinase
MLASQVVSSILLLLYVVRQPSALRFDVAIITVLMVLIVYVVAVFGFRIFDPLPVARQAVLQQMHAAFIVFDARWRVLGLNPAAEDLLRIVESMARGKTWGQVTPPGELLLPDLSASGAGDLPDITLGRGADTRYYAPALSALADFRGLLMGYLLMLRDVTEERRGYAQALERQRAQAIQSERERMARELHDSLGQVLSYTSMQVETAAQLALDGQGEAAAARLSRLGTVVRDAHADLRESILNLQSAARFEDPFCSVAQHYLDGFTRNYDIRAQLHVEGNFGEEALRPETKLHLLRILQEALSNARKHGQAHQVQVTLARANGCLRMTVEDDGIGFDPQQFARDGGAHFGLQFMADRAEALGGSLQVTSTPGGGTRVVLEIPADGPRLTGDGGRP